MEDVVEEAKKEKTADAEIALVGVDVKRGIFLSGGTLALYLETLVIFCKDGLKKIKELTACLEAGDLPLYTVHVHALKSAAANIGANGLSMAAKELEAAGAKNDLAFIEANSERFIMDLESLMNIISNALSKFNRTGDSGNDEYDREALVSDLEKLKTALDAFDAGTINKTIDSLRSTGFPGSISFALDNISEKVLIGEYEEAVELINKILEDGNSGTL
jgi:HPt (histidine-containing phosphotransfer) domain-containing protein